jgi:hypothetical protein
MFESFSLYDSAFLSDILCPYCGIHEYSSLLGCYVGHRCVFNNLEESVATIFWLYHVSWSASL